MDDSVLDGLWFNPASGAGEVRFFVEPGGVGRKITFSGAHLIEPRHHELPKAPERLRFQAGRLIVTEGGGCVFVPIVGHHVPCPNG